METNLGNGLEFNGSSISIDYGTGLNIIAGEIVARNSESLWNSNQLQGIGITTTLPSTDQILTYNGTNWTPDDLGSLLTSGTGISINNNTISAQNTFNI